jgi:3-dehydroquinate synthase
MIRVELGERSYPIAITSGDSGAGALARSVCGGSLAWVVCDTNTRPHAERVAASLAAAGFWAESHAIPPGEEQKCLATAALLYERLSDLRADRRTLVVAVGGGVIGDLAGFVAATYARGLPLFMAPTTLLAMVDSSVGGKVGVNLPAGKNLVGAFHQPVAVWIDTDTLATLPERELRAGLAEVVKYGVALDEAFFAWLEANVTAILARDPAALRYVVTRCCQLKASVVEKDEREVTGLRAVLNYGHTFAHAFEKVTGYGAWLHGEAVAMGMGCAARLAARRGLVSPDLPARQEALLKAFGLPAGWSGGQAEAVLEAMRADKKAEAGRLRFVLPSRLGEARLIGDVRDDEVRAVL